MDRREHYDPEDIENLLQERAFDELLDEERAFVLRHMSGREEYDRMRALLHYVRPDERSRSTIEPDEAIRSNVMQAFQAQRTPTWRVWLNSVAVWFAPPDASAFWRPALAFGSLAILLLAGYFTVTYMAEQGQHTGLAEVKVEQKNELEGGMLPTGDTASAPVASEPVPGSVAGGSQAVVDAHSNDLDVNTQRSALLSDAEQRKERYMVDELEVAEDAPSTGRELKETTNKDADEAVEALSLDFAPASTTSGHLVTQEELMRNQSLANVTISKTPSAGKSRARADAEAPVVMASSRSLGQDQNLLGLVTASW
ncbi:MAG: hypothetical protein R2818_12595 [Flavobacteriales bacterium]